MIYNKKAQAWGFDLIIATSVFIIALITFYFFSINYSNETEEIYSVLEYEGNLLADNLLSEGYPLDWTNESVERIGILNEGKINQTKLEYYYSLSILDYNKTKILFNIKRDYYLNFSNTMLIEGTPVQQIGLIPTEPRNLIKINRVVIYDNKPVSLYVYMWE